MNRREFLKGTAWMGAAAFAAGCQLNRLGFGEGGQMQNYVYRKLMGKRVRVGFIGIGRHGCGPSRLDDSRRGRRCALRRKAGAR